MMDSLFDGFSLCHEIKTSEEYKEFNDTPIIFVSAVKEKTGSRFQFNTIEQGLVGPDDYIDKPVKSKDLLARIEKLLNK
jgi:CheY-like chemotaxis protein